MSLSLPSPLCLPGYGADSLAAVLPAVGAALGAGLVTSTGLDGHVAREHLGVPTAERVCVVLVDGLGYENLSARAGHAPVLRELLPAARTLTTSFPATTAAAIGTFGTGTAPGRTGMLGYTQRVDGDLANMVSWAGAPAPEALQREEPMLARIFAEGIRVTAVGPARFADSGMTIAALRAPRYRPATTLGESVAAAASALREPGLVYLYWGAVDKIGHHHGWQSPEWADALEAFDRGLRRLIAALPGGSVTVVTADHGMVDADPAARLDIAAEPELASGLDLVGGEPRALHLYTAEPEAVAARWRGVLGPDALVAMRDEAVRGGLFGPAVRDHVLTGIGDVVVAMGGRATVVDSRRQSAAAIGLIGVHGSLTSAELTVPLLVAG